MNDEYNVKVFKILGILLFFDIRLHDSQTEEDRVPTSGSDTVDEGPREALQREENVGRSQRGTLIIVYRSGELVLLINP